LDLIVLNDQEMQNALYYVEGAILQKKMIIYEAEPLQLSKTRNKLPI